jgi:LmbE family N-acetylglucosaminyl deacetylase
LKIYILSPHIDDAAFGLALIVSKCASYNISVTIINCFTITKWTAVPVENKELNAVSILRKNEDLQFYRAINSNIEIINLDLLDAPLRNGYIFQQQPFRPDELELIEELSQLLKSYTDGLLFCPLGIGNHIDHAICRKAVLKLYGNSDVLFYEDLPYANRIKQSEILEHIEELQRELGTTLANYTDGLLNCMVDKKQVISLYKSQMNEEISSEIISHLNALKGERIWGEETVIAKLREVLSKGGL